MRLLSIPVIIFKKTIRMITSRCEQRSIWPVESRLFTRSFLEKESIFGNVNGDISEYTFMSDVTVEVSTSKAFLANAHCKERTSESIIFLGGFGLSENSKLIHDICYAFCRTSGIDTYAITTRSVERGTYPVGKEPDLLYEEARAVVEFIAGQHLGNVIVVGHSQGGNKAIDVARILNGNPAVRAKGLILLNPVGLYEQDPVKLAMRFLGETVVRVPFNALISWDGWRFTGSIFWGIMDALRNILNEVRRSRTKYLQRLRSEILEMSRRNPHASSIDIPVILVFGSKDTVSDIDHISPLIRSAIEKRAAFGRKDKRSGDASSPKKAVFRHEHTRVGGIFPRSPCVRVLVAEKFGTHALPFLYPEVVAESALSALSRCSM